MNIFIKRTLGGLLGLLFSIMFYMVFALVVLMLIFGPFLALSDIKEVARYGAPKDNIHILFLCFVSFMLYLSMRVKRLRGIYNWCPVLLPAFQMAFIMLTATSVALVIMNLWADDLLFPKAVAIAGAAICLLAGRAFMSYWYYKYPISAEMRK